MSLANSRNDRRIGAGQPLRKWAGRNNGNGEEPGVPSNPASSGAIEQQLDTSAEDWPLGIDFQYVELTDCLMRFAGDDEPDSSTESQTELKGARSFETGQALIDAQKADSKPKANASQVGLADFSYWFNFNDADASRERGEKQQKTVSEKRPSDSGRAEQQHKTVSEKRPSDSVRVEAQPNTFSEKRPSDSVRAEEQPKTFSEKRPSGPVRAEPQPKTVSEKRPSDSVRVEPQPKTVSEKRPSDSVRAELQPNIFSEKRPSDSVRSERQPKTFSEKRPSDSVRVEQHLRSVSEKRPSDSVRAEQPKTVSQDRASGRAKTAELASNCSIPIGAYSSTLENVDDVDVELIASGADQATDPNHDERRRHPREESSDLIWVEYFDSLMERIAKEAGRVENVSGGGMRIAVKTAPRELERVIVSYPHRGFESCSIVRSRFQDQKGQEHLCLQFADREWRINASSPFSENSFDLTTKRILLADDDTAFRKVLGNILTKAGYEVVLAENGQRAVEQAASERPDLVITDGLMPKLHGFQVCKAVKELIPPPKVIMLTAVYTTPKYICEIRSKFGADDVIAKPCEIADLLRKIEELIPRAQLVA